MALIDCPECGREVSSSAPACPECAYPVATGTPPVPPAAVSPASTTRDRWWNGLLPVVARVAIGTFIMAVGGGEEESVAAVIGGGLIGLSAFPAWYRRKIERLKGGSASPLAARVDARMADLDQQYRSQLARLEEQHATQIADLEERIDFTERLLTKNRE